MKRVLKLQKLSMKTVETEDSWSTVSYNCNNTKTLNP
jgi:hypothetical protein